MVKLILWEINKDSHAAPKTHLVWSHGSRSNPFSYDLPWGCSKNNVPGLKISFLISEAWLLLVLILTIKLSRKCIISWVTTVALPQSYTMGELIMHTVKEDYTNKIVNISNRPVFFQRTSVVDCEREIKEKRSRGMIPPGLEVWADLYSRQQSLRKASHNLLGSCFSPPTHSNIPTSRCIERRLQ